MRKILILLAPFYFISCTLQHSMDRANELMTQNIQLMEESRVAIEENTHQIKRSTDTMIEFQVVFPIMFGIILVAILFIISRFIYKAVKRRKRQG